MMIGVQDGNVRKRRATPARQRPHCYAVRKDLDPGRYATIEDLKAAIARGDFDCRCGAMTQREVNAANEDCLI